MSWSHSPIFLSIPLTMQLIKHNKKQIRELETERKYLEHMISQHYWPCSDPLDNRISSHISFTLLNKAKDDLREIKKKLKMLAEVQYALKYSIR